MFLLDRRNKIYFNLFFIFIPIFLFNITSVNAANLAITNISLNASQQNVTFTIGINSSSMSTGQGVRINYSIANLDPYCTKNFDTGYCDQITSNDIDLQQIRLWFGDNLTYQSLSTSLYGIQNYLGYTDLTVPSISSSCYDIKAELVYVDESNNNVTQFLSSNVIQRGNCLAKNTTSQPCSNYIGCQEGLFCGDTNNDGIRDTCLSSSTNYTYSCEKYGAGTSERISSIDNNCRFYYSGLQNKNLKDGELCIYQSDCLNNYCWDSNGNLTTVCNSAGTNGNSTGILVSTSGDCLSPSCYEYWKCYPAGTILSGKTCSDGIWGKKIANVTLKSEYRNITYTITSASVNSTYINVNATLTNNESTTFGMNSSYFYLGDGVNITRAIGVNLNQGQSRTETYSAPKPSSSIRRYYVFYVESLITNSTTYWWTTSDSQCYDSQTDSIATSCTPPAPQWSSNSTSIVSTYSLTVSSFNITWASSLGISKVLFETNFSGSATNYTMTQIATNIYNYNNTLPAGTFYWKSYANATNNYWNNSNTWYFTISKGSITTLQINSNVTSPITYPTASSVNGAGCPSGQSDVTCTLYRGNSSWSGTGNDSVLLGAGVYAYNYSTSGGANWTAASANNYTLTITQLAQIATVTILPSSTVAYPTQTNASCSRTGDPTNTIILYRNGAQVASGTSSPQSEIATLTVGIYNYTCIISGNANASAAISANNYLNVSGAGAYSYDIRGSAYDSSTGTSIQSGSVTGIIKETGERFTGLITNGAYTLTIPTNVNLNQTRFTVGIILTGGGKQGYNQIIVGTGPFYPQTQKCSTNQLHFKGSAIDASSGTVIDSGTMTINVKEVKTYTNSTTVSNGVWDIYISPCLISGGLYTFNVLVASSDGRQSNLFVNQVAP